LAFKASAAALSSSPPSANGSKSSSSYFFAGAGLAGAGVGATLGAYTTAGSFAGSTGLTYFSHILTLPITDYTALSYDSLWNHAEACGIAFLNPPSRTKANGPTNEMKLLTSASVILFPTSHFLPSRCVFRIFTYSFMPLTPLLKSSGLNFLPNTLSTIL